MQRLIFVAIKIQKKIEFLAEEFGRKRQIGFRLILADKIIQNPHISKKATKFGRLFISNKNCKITIGLCKP
jgi:hypothetical protein